MSNCSRPTGAKDRGRRRFFFVHIMKTGGTTLVHRLRNHFGSAVYPTMRVDGTDMVDMWELYLRTDRLLAQLAARGDQIELIAGHFPLCTRELLEPRPMTITLLREPVERTLSYLSSVRGESLEDKEEDRLERTFAEMWGHPAYDPKNNMTRMLSLDLNEVQSPKSGRTRAKPRPSGAREMRARSNWTRSVSRRGWAIFVTSYRLGSIGTSGKPSS